MKPGRCEPIDPAAVAAAFEVEGFLMSSGIDHGCSIVSRYMSRTCSVPSGALTKLTGRNQLSVEATNSDARSIALGAEGDARRGSSRWRWIRLVATSPRKAWPRYSGG